MVKKRLDNLLFEKGLTASVQEAQARILAGEVWLKERRLEKAGDKFLETDPIEVRSRTPAFASRAGHKLEHALESFQIPVEQRVCLDIGASTGGFTDCLLKRNAKHVICVDVGYGTLDSHLRNHARVTNLERTNARSLDLQTLKSKTDLAEEISLIVIDVSFISLRKIVEPLAQTLSFCLDWVFLFKPQFEVGPENLLQGGIVKDSSISIRELADFDSWIQGLGFVSMSKAIESPLAGKRSGNLEYLLYYRRKGQ